MKRAFYSTLLALSGLSVVAEAQSNTSSVPPELAQMVDKILGLIQYLGVAVLVGGLIFTGIQLATSDTPEEQARAKKRLGLIILAGAIMTLARPLVAWLTGYTPP